MTKGLKRRIVRKLKFKRRLRGREPAIVKDPVFIPLSHIDHVNSRRKRSTGSTDEHIAVAQERKVRLHERRHSGDAISADHQIGNLIGAERPVIGILRVINVVTYTDTRNDRLIGNLQCHSLGDTIPAKVHEIIKNS